MYFVKYGKEYLHDPRHEEYVLLDLSIDSEANSCGYCDFTIYPDHPMYNKIRERDADNPVEVYDGDILLFAGYIYELGKEFYQDGHVKCKGELSYLSESIVRPYSTVQRGFGTLAPHTLSAYFEWLIEQHNNQVSENKRFKMGINQGSVLTTESYLYLENDSYPNTLDEINDKILGDDGYGGYICIRHEGSDRYIDYISNWTESNTQILDFGKNLTDYTQTDDSDEIASFVVPLGAPMSQTTYDYDDGYRVTLDTKPASNKTYYTYDSEDKRYIQCGNMTAFESGVTYYEYYENYDESNNALTIDGLATRTYDNDYRNLNDMIYSDKAVKKYGWVGFTYKNENITDKDVLAYYGAVALKQRVSPKRTMEIKAIDMHLINPDVKPIRIGEYVRVRSKPHNLDRYFLCTSITLDLNTPQNSLYTLGSSFNTLTGEQNKKNKELNAAINTAYDAAAKLTEKEKQTAINVSQALTTADDAKKAAASAVTAQDDTDIMMVDHEYRLTLMELGL